MSTQTVFVASNLGETLQPIPFRTSSDTGTTNTVHAGLWSTGESVPGTGELPVANLGLGFGRIHGSLYPVPEIISYGGKVLFSTNGLWVSDGTPLGTYQIAANVFTGFVDFNNFPLQRPTLTPFQGEILFVGNSPTGLFLTDGTTAGTHQIVAQSGVPANIGLKPQNLMVLGNQLLFSGAMTSVTRVLWSSDGGANTSVLLNSTGQQVLEPRDITVFGNRALFEAGDGANGYGLWVTDGTASGTSQITVAGAGPDGPNKNSLSPTGLAVIGGQAVFSGTDASGHIGLWRTDGTSAGTYELAVPGAVASQYDTLGLRAIGTKAVFNDKDASGNEALWVTDGTTAGTMEIAAGLSTTMSVATSSRVIFTTEGSTSLYVTDGTAAGTGVLSVPGASAAGLIPGLQGSDGSLVTFTGFDANGTLGLWSTDGTSAGTREVVAGLPQVAVGPLDFASVSSPPLYFTTLQTLGFNGSGVVRPGTTLQIALSTNQPVTVQTANFSLDLRLSNGRAALYAPALSTATQLVFSYYPTNGDDTPDLRVNALELNGGRISDSAGDTLLSTSLTGFSTSDTGIQVSSDVQTATPIITSPRGGLLTNVAAPSLSGTDTPGTTVRLYDGPSAIANSGVTDASGAWRTTAMVAGLGLHQITATATGPSTRLSAMSAPVPLFELAAPVNGISSAEMASVDVTSVLGQGFALQFTAGTEAVQFLDGTLSVGPDTDAAYVGRLYVGLFGVVPDSGNLSLWTNFLAAGHSQTEVAAGFLAAPAAAPLAALSDGQYLQKVFTGLLGHGPTAAQLGAFTGVLAAGVTRADVLAGIAGSPEAKAALAPQTARLFATNTATQSVNDLFRAGLGHNATQPVVQSLGGSLQSGLTALQLAQEIASTPEFLGRHGGQGDASYVTDVYAAGLGRAPSGGELGSVVGGLQAGVFDRGTILAAVATSPEGIAHLTQPL